MSIKGFIFNIQRFSLHDGPGIRTTVFFKGCPLSCPWCQNPEGLSPNYNLFHTDWKCLGCRSCEKACSKGAIKVNGKGPFIERAKCNLCLDCVSVCPAEALEAAGREITVSELAIEVLKDRVIFEESGGGVTFSGGEPLMQPVFLTATLKKLKEQNIHTAVETSGCASQDVLDRVIPWTDLFIFDLKLVDPEKCKQYTGVSISSILSNLNILTDQGCRVKVRMPLIPSVNDDTANLKQTAAILASNGIDEIELIPYHNLGIAKYKGLDLEYELSHLKGPDPEKIASVKATLNQYGIAARSEG